MPKVIQQGRITQALAEAMGLKGRYPLQLDETAVPTMQVFDVQGSPYGRFPVPAIAVAGSPAVAGRFSYVGAQAQSEILEIMGLSVTNAGAGVTRVDAGLVTPAQFAIDFTTTFSGQFVDGSGALDPTGAIALLPHFVLVGSLVNFNWTQVLDAQLAATSTVTYQLPQRIFLRPGGPIFFVRNTTANVAVGGVSFYARSWPLGG